MQQKILLAIVNIFFLNILSAQFAQENILFSGIENPKKIETLDSNNDDALDLIILNEKGALTLIRGMIDGTFSEFSIIKSENINDFSLFDKDVDGDLDILIIQSDDQIFWLENDQSGIFTTEHYVAEFTNSSNSIIKFADIDQDNDFDIIGGIGSSVFWLENLGNDTYSDKETLSYNLSGIQELYLLDFDNDEDFDILAVTNNVGIRILENEGNLDFSIPVTIGPDALSSQFIDLDADGDKDLLYTSANSNISWIRNNGDATFNSLLINTSASWPVACHAADLDNDGDLDILSGSTNDNKLAWYEQISTGYFGSQQIIDNELDNPIDIVVGDFFNNGYVGVVVVSNEESQVKGYKNNASNNFNQEVIISPPFLEPEYLHFKDVNNDDTPDIVFVADRKHIYAAINTCNGDFEFPILIFTPPEPFGISTFTINDFDNDGDNDIIIGLAHLLMSHRLGYSAFENGAFQEFDLIEYTSTNLLISTELTGDEWIDMIQYDWVNSNLNCYTNQSGNFNMDNKFEIDISYSNPPLVRFEDMDNDGDKDLIGIYNNSAILVWNENLGDGTFSNQQQYQLPNEYYTDMELSDADADGDLDIFIGAGIEDKIIWFENFGNFEFSEYHQIDLDFNVIYLNLSILDINQDNLKDIIVNSNSSQEMFQLLALGNGLYNPPEPIFSGHEIDQDFIADIDGDGDMDLLFIDENQHRIGWFQVLGDNLSQLPIVYTIEKSDSLLCNADQSGFISITPMHSNCNEYTISWQDSLYTGFELQNLEAGNYIYHITDVNGVSVTDSAYIYQPSQIELIGNTIGSSQSTFEGSAWVIPSGGTPPYSFQWNDLQSSNTDSIFSLSPGDYSVTVTDINNCQVTTSLTVDILTKNMSIYKTPVVVYPTLINQSKIYFSIDENFEEKIIIELIDLQGKKVDSIQKADLRNGDFINISHINPGVYFINISSNDFNSIHKVLKAN